MPRITNIDKSGTAIGSIKPHSGGAVPAGYLFCDGSIVSATTYSYLFAKIGSVFNVGGEGAGNFRLPDAGGIFLRGAGTNTTLTDAVGAPYSVTLGARQYDQMQGHVHPQGAGNFSAVTIAAGGAGYFLANNSPYNTGSPVSDGTNGNTRVGVETRPANVAVNYIIAYI